MPAHKHISDSEDDDEFSDGSGSDGEREGVCRRRAWPNLLMVGLAVAVICFVALEIHRRSAGVLDAALTAGVENAWRTCSGEGRPGGPAADLHLHFLFMAGRGLPHLDIWRRFFEGAPGGSYSLWVHCEFPDACKASFALQGLADFVVVPTVYNAWCEDLVSPMVQLARCALNASADVPTKFLFVSESSLPVKPIEVIRAELAKHPSASDFCVYPSYQWLSARDYSRYLPKAGQWSVLSRQDAEVLVQRLPPPSADRAMLFPPIANLTCADFEECYCPDEQFVFGTIFGAYRADVEPNVFPGVGPILLHEPFGSPMEQGCCRTWLMYGPGRPDYGAREEAYMKNVSQLGFLLADLQSDNYTVLAAPMTHGMEAIYIIHALGPRGLEALRRSSFLFARKFDPNATFPGFADVMFSA